MQKARVANWFYLISTSISECMTLTNLLFINKLKLNMPCFSNVLSASNTNNLLPSVLVFMVLSSKLGLD